MKDSSFLNHTETPRFRECEHPGCQAKMPDHAIGRLCPEHERAQDEEKGKLKEEEETK